MKTTLISRVKQNKYSIIIGCGRLGSRIANELSANDEDVLIIDRDEEAFRKLSKSYGGLTLVGDGTDLALLKEANVKKASTVILTTDNDNINILISQMLKIIFNKEFIIARLYDSEKDYVYEELGIKTICPVDLSIQELNRYFKNRG
ncbi:potassium channel family protein [Amphibacillus jilinensis]|uniref:potassium channel family protein n=1 Tax=Amphibacillus jilinensis TaxID=1216008 RepID=UPI0002E4E7C9|nr:TrkA family potassium uptake protein [Amphibacillus jilinensis]